MDNSKVCTMQDFQRVMRGIIILILLNVFICYQILRERKEMRSPYHCFNERRWFIQTEVTAANTTFDQEQDGETNCLLSYLAQANFTDFKCPKVKVNFSNVNLPRVALASFPGSGNTWLRHLIEKMSGIATGSIYCGTKEMQLTFVGECEKINPGSIVIKTHELPTGKRSRKYDKAVLIIRNPFHVLLADFNLANSGKTSVASKQRFRSKYWTNFVQSRILEWKNHIYSWLTNFTGPKHIVFYEHSQNQLLEELVRLSVFLELNSKPSDIWCTVQNQEGRFHRKKPEWFVASSLFNDKMKATFQSEIHELYKLMTKHAVSCEVRKNFDLFYRNK